MDSPRTLSEAVTYFADPANCLEYLVARRWPNGVSCPACGSPSVYFDKTRQGWICKGRHPRRKFSLKTGTVFEDSPLGLDKWLPVVWMIANSRNGVRASEIQHALGVTQKTAWFMLHRIRLAMQEAPRGELSNDVEAGAIEPKEPDVERPRSPDARVVVTGLLDGHGKTNSRVWLRVLKGLRRYGAR